MSVGNMVALYLEQLDHGGGRGEPFPHVRRQLAAGCVWGMPKKGQLSSTLRIELNPMVLTTIWLPCISSRWTMEEGEGEENPFLIFGDS